MNLKVFTVSKNKFLEPSSVSEFNFSPENDKSVYWINIEQPTPDKLAEFFSPMKLHPLILEGCLEPSANSRIVPYDQALFIQFPVQSERCDVNHYPLSIICLPYVIISVCEESLPVLESIASDYTSAMRFRAQSTSAIAYQILDHIVDKDLLFAFETHSRVETIEENFNQGAVSDLIGQILTLNRKAAQLEIVFEDQRNCIASLQTVESEVFDIREFREYFRDILTHLDYAIRSVDRQQRRLSELHQHYLLALHDRTNDRLKILTILSAIFMPLTLIAGIYGMNFIYMPELKWHYGYPSVMFLMLAITSVMLWFFYWKGWFK